jgi:16S rRNA (adenine1518-N6/adenine1519-N6)-dimethyltransferase
MRLLIDSANIQKEDTVLEVGCGTGSLTEEIAARAGFCAVAEYDTTLARIAAQRLTGADNVRIINTDILENKNAIKPEILKMIEEARGKLGGRFLLVANLPYSVASPVISNLITGGVVADEMFVTIQKEVAFRLMAKAGDDHYGSLGVLIGATGQIELIRVLKPSVFWPRPEVDSAIISYRRDAEKISRIKNLSLFSECIDLFMQHRRKQLKACTKFAKGSLGGIKNWPEIFEKLGLEPTTRPDHIRAAQYVAMANLCDEVLSLK